jgi:hypothetical protein
VRLVIGRYLDSAVGGLGMRRAGGQARDLSAGLGLGAVGGCCWSVREARAGTGGAMRAARSRSFPGSRWFSCSCRYVRMRGGARLRLGVGTAWFQFVLPFGFATGDSISNGICRIWISSRLWSGVRCRVFPLRSGLLCTVVPEMSVRRERRGVNERRLNDKKSRIAIGHCPRGVATPAPRPSPASTRGRGTPRVGTRRHTGPGTDPPAHPDPQPRAFSSLDASPAGSLDASPHARASAASSMG